MRLVFTMCVAIMAILSTDLRAFAQVGTTEITFGNVQYVGKPVKSVNVPFTLELDSTCKGFVSYSISAEDTSWWILIPPTITVNTTLAPPPAPGKGATNLTGSFAVTSGHTYSVTVTMDFINNKGQQATITKTLADISP